MYLGTIEYEDYYTLSLLNKVVCFYSSMNDTDCVIIKETEILIYNSSLIRYS